MTGRPVAPEGPAGDSGQENTVPSVIPDKIPSAIDTAAERVGVPTEPLPDADVVGATDDDIARVPESQVNNTDGADGEDTSVVGGLTQEQIQMLTQDHNVMNIIRNDPKAAEWLDKHFKQKARQENGGLPDPQTDDTDVPDSAMDAKIDRLFDTVNQVVMQNQQLTARLALSEFKAANPIVQNPKVAAKMQQILREPGCESLSLQKVLTIALSELGISGKPGARAPLQASETGGAGSRESSTEDKVQTAIDGQDSFEKGLDLALRETAKEQGFF